MIVFGGDEEEASKTFVFASKTNDCINSIVTAAGLVNSLKH